MKNVHSLLAPQAVLCRGTFAEKLRKIIARENTERVLVVSGRNLYTATGAEDAVASMNSTAEIKVFNYSSPNPTIEDIQSCIAVMGEWKPQIVVGLGGGTAMDVAKAATAIAANPDKPLDYVLKKSKLMIPPLQKLVLIPTTTGTGSETTQFAVVYVESIKHSLDHEFLLPTWSLLDANLPLTLPPKIQAATILDALGQSVESHWSIHSTQLSRQYAEEAIELIWDTLNEKKCDGLDASSQEKLLVASHLSGRAINITRTTAAHAMSYALTSNFGIPHGLAVGLLLPAFLTFNYDTREESLQDNRGIAHVRDSVERIAKLLRCKSVQACAEWLTELLREFGFSPMLRDHGVTNAHIDEQLVPAFNVERGKNNPRRVTQADLSLLLKNIW